MGEAKTGETQYVEQAYTELNPLTGLYYSHNFFKKADEYLGQAKPKDYCLVAIDIEHFRLFNKLYGRDSGDELLIYIAECVRKIQDAYHSVAGYLGGDNFGVLMPANMDQIRELKYEIIRGVKKWNNSVGFLPAIGVCVIDDPSVEAVLLYDRATLAVSNVLGNYTKRICWYQASMEERMEEELKLLSEIQLALEKEEFTFFAQPQCDISTGKIVGAESLVRWNHSEKGLISPGVFIPVLEKNGFIADLDRYVWKKVCQWLRSWIDRGYHPVPVSINVSRLDIFSMDVPEYLLELLRTYELPARLLKVEITESAYAESNDKIIKAVKNLQDAGFLVMMDDFGSGYSSLNILKDMEIDYLKIDMKFLQQDLEFNGKGEKVLTSIVRMAKWLHLPSIVEGVETAEQVDFLKCIGCEYAQGFYFAKPMPVDDYEKYIEKEHKKESQGARNENVSMISELWNTRSTVSMLFDILDVPIAVYEYRNDKMELLRSNKLYESCIATDDEMLMKDEKRELQMVFEGLAQEQKECELEFQREYNKWYRLSVKVIGNRADTQIIMVTFHDISDYK